MIAPGLFRRALARGAQWRVLLLWVSALLLPALLAALPVFAFLGRLLDHAPQAPRLVRALDSAALIELVRQLGEPFAADAMGQGLSMAALATFLLAPPLAALSVAAARLEGRPGLRELLRSAGDFYGRLLRMALLAALPLGLAAAGSALAFKLAKNAAEAATRETAAQRGSRLAWAAAAILVAVAHVTLEAGRAHFAAQPSRRSAFLAWWSGVRLFLRRPLRVLGICAVTAAAGPGLGALLMAAHLRLAPSSAGGVLLSFLVAQLAVAAVAWGRVSRLAGLAELVHADAAERLRRGPPFEMAPPLASPPPAQPLPAPREAEGPA